jgi:hypothetical protein
MIDVPLHLQPIVEAIVKELERQRDENGPALGWLDTDELERATVDGHVDLVALARAVLFAPTGDNHHNAAQCPHCQGRT